MGQSEPPSDFDVWWALRDAAYHSITRSVPADLLPHLLTGGLWRPERALAHVQRVPNAEQRVKALAGVVPHLPVELLGPALDAATVVAESWRADALGVLAPRLPVDLLRQAFDAAMAMDAEEWQAEALCALAPYLPADLCERALRAGTAFDDAHARATALTALLPHLPADRRATVADAVIAAIADVTGPVSLFRPRQLPALAPYLSADLCDRALAIADAVTVTRFRSEAMLNLVPYLPAGRRATVLDELWPAILTDIAWPQIRWPLLELLPYLSAGRRTEVFDALAATVTEPPVFPCDVTRLVRRLPADRRRGVLDQALANIDNDPFTWGTPSWGGDKAPLAVFLPADERLRLLGDLLAEAAADDERGVWKLLELIPHLPAELLEEALTVARTVQHGRFRAEALAALLAHLPASRRAEVTHEAFAAAYGHAARYATHAVDVVAGYRRSRDLPGAAAPVERHAPVARLDQELVAAAALPDDAYRVAALEALAPHLPAPLLDQALATALAITELDPPMLTTAGPADTYGPTPCGPDDSPHSPWT